MTPLILDAGERRCRMGRKILVVVTGTEKYPNLNRPTAGCQPQDLRERGHCLVSLSRCRRPPDIRLLDGSLLIEGKQVTGFSDEEERLVELDKYVPFLTEDELVKRGAIYKKAEKPWMSRIKAIRASTTAANPSASPGGWTWTSRPLRCSRCRRSRRCGSGWWAGRTSPGTTASPFTGTRGWRAHQRGRPAGRVGVGRDRRLGGDVRPHHAAAAG